MDSMSLVVTSEIKYTEQHSYNKEWKTTYCQFYLIVKTIARKAHVYQTIKLFQATLDNLRILQYKIVMGMLPTNTLLVK